MSASPGGRVIGRVSVKVLPDTSDFKRKAQNQIDRIEKQLGAIKVGLDKQSLDHVERQLKDWANDMSPLEVLVRPKLMVGSTTWAEKRLDYLTRPRAVPLMPYLHKGAAAKVAASIGTMVAAASGGRVLSNWLEDIGRAFKNLDKSVPLIGSIVTAILGLAAVGITSISNLAALSYSLAQIGAAALTLPGTLAGVAIGVGTLIAVFKDFNTVLPGVKDQLAKLQDSMSEKFWKKAKAPIKDFIDTMMPKFKSGFDRTAVAAGEFFATFANHWKKSLKLNVDGMFDGLIKGMQNAQGAAVPLANIITALGNIGASYLPRLGQWVKEIAVQFDVWLARVSGDGTLQEWIDQGLVALADLGRVLTNLGGIILGIGRAAAAAGGSTLTLMADTLERVHKVVDSPAFQEGLTKVFAAAHAAMTQIATMSGPAVKEMFASFVPLLQSLLPIMGETVGMLANSLAQALSNPALQAGLVALMTGIQAAVAGLAPALEPIAVMLGTLGGVLGTFLASVGPMLGTVLGTLAQGLTTLLPALEPLIVALSGGLNAAIQALIPAFTLIVLAISNLLVALAPVIAVMIAALVPVLAQVGTQIGVVLIQALNMLTPLLPMIASLFVALVPVIGQLLAAVLPLIPPLLQLVMQVLTPLIPVITQIVTDCLPPMMAAFSGLVQAVIPVLGILGQLVSLLMAILVPAIKFAAGMLTTVWTVAVKIVTGILDVFVGFIDRTISDIKSIWNGGWEGIKQGAKDALSNMRTVLTDAGKKLIQGLLDGIDSMVGTVKGKLNELTDMLPDWKGPAEKDKTLLFDAGRLVIDGFINGLESRYDAVRQSLGSLTDSVANTEFRSPAIPSIAGGFGGIDAALAAPQTGLLGSGSPVEINIPTTTNADPEDIADALLYAIRRVSHGGVYATRKG